MFSEKVYIERRNKLLSQGLKGIGLFIGNKEVPMNYPANTYRFRQDSTFTYFFGLQEPDLIAIIDFDTGKQILFGDDVDINGIIWMGPQKSLKDKAVEVGIHETYPLAEFHKLIENYLKENRKIHFLPPYRAETKIFLEEVLNIKPSEQKNLASTELIKAVVKLRSVKSNEEIAELDFACNIGYEMHTTAIKMTKKNVKEIEIAGKIEGIALSYGGNLSFPIILTKNGQILHNHYHGNILNDGDLVLIDAGFETQNYYSSDFTRVVPVGGKFSQRQKEIYEIVLKANNEATSIIKPGITFKEVHFYACEIITSGLKELGLMKGDVKEAVNLGAHALFFPHGLGHMIGLDVHDMEDFGENYVGYDEETPKSQQFGHSFLRFGKRLEKGYTVTVEPGIYFIPELINLWKSENKFSDFINYEKVFQYLDFGGIRIEDDVLVTENGHRLLGNKRIPVTVKEIEDFMMQ